MFRCYALMAWMVHKTAAGVGFRFTLPPYHDRVTNRQAISKDILNTLVWASSKFWIQQWILRYHWHFKGLFNININGLILGTKMFFCHFKNRLNFYHSSDRTSKTEEYWHRFTKKKHQRLMTNIIIIFLKGWV